MAYESVMEFLGEISSLYVKKFGRLFTCGNILLNVIVLNVRLKNIYKSSEIIFLHNKYILGS